MSNWTTVPIATAPGYAAALTVSGLGWRLVELGAVTAPDSLPCRACAAQLAGANLHRLQHAPDVPLDRREPLRDEVRSTPYHLGHQPGAHYARVDEAFLPSPPDDVQCRMDEQR